MSFFERGDHKIKNTLKILKSPSKNCQKVIEKFKNPTYILKKRTTKIKRGQRDQKKCDRKAMKGDTSILRKSASILIFERLPRKTKIPLGRSKKHLILKSLTKIKKSYKTPNFQQQHPLKH